MKKTVLLVLGRNSAGGVARHVADLAVHLQSSFKVIVVTGEKEPEEVSSAYMFSDLEEPPIILPELKRKISIWNDLVSLLKVYRIIRKYNPDIVHTHGSKGGLVGRFAGKLTGRPVIIHSFHGHVFRHYFSGLKSNLLIRLERWLAGMSDKIIVLSESQKEELCTRYKIAPESKFKTIPLGFCLEHFQENTPEKRRAFRDEFLLEKGDIAIGVVNRLTKIKNHKLFIRVFGQLLNETNVPIKAFIVGEGKENDSLKELADQLNIAYANGINHEKYRSSKIIFTSWRKDIDTVMAGLDIVVSTSTMEGTPVSLMEAQVAQKPILSTNVGGVSDIVRENKTAILTESQSELKLKQELLELIENESYREQLTKQDPNEIMDQFDINRMIDQIKSLYLSELEAK